MPTESVLTSGLRWDKPAMCSGVRCIGHPVRGMRGCVKLSFHEGQNFGDALNPFIFESLLPDFFDDDTSSIFIGIGSILGLIKGKAETTTKVVFSSGYAAGNPSTYGEAPDIDGSYDIVCVRGPETARHLGLPQSLAVADGALLIGLIDVAPTESKHRCSYIPHVGSEDMYPDWPLIASEAGMNYISPRSSVEMVLQEIASSDLVVAEAMHGAIVADALGVPWVPASGYDTINQFKWQDYCASVNLSYDPYGLPTIYGQDYLEKVFRLKLPGRLPAPVYRAAATTYRRRPGSTSRGQVVEALGGLAEVEPTLSDRTLIGEKAKRLHALLIETANRYS